MKCSAKFFYSELIHGDCGLIVYYKENDGRCKPMGMFVGKLKAVFHSGKNIYLAIILNQAFKDLEQDYPHHIEHIRLFEAPRPVSQDL